METLASFFRVYEVINCEVLTKFCRINTNSLKFSPSKILSRTVYNIMYIVVRGSMYVHLIIKDIISSTVWSHTYYH